MNIEREEAYHEKVTDYVKDLIDKIGEPHSPMKIGGILALEELQTQIANLDNILSIQLLPANSQSIGYRKLLSNDSKVLNYTYENITIIRNSYPGNTGDPHGSPQGRRYYLDMVSKFIGKIAMD